MGCGDFWKGTHPSSGQEVPRQMRGSAGHPLPLLRFKSIIPPCLMGGGVSGIPLPPLAGRDPPFPCLSRVTLAVHRQSVGPETPCNNARFPFLRWGVSGIPPPHIVLQTDHTPPPGARGGCLIPPGYNRELRDTRGSRAVEECDFTSGGPTNGVGIGPDQGGGGCAGDPPIDGKSGGDDPPARFRIGPPAA